MERQYTIKIAHADNDPESCDYDFRLIRHKKEIFACTDALITGLERVNQQIADDLAAEGV